MDGLVLIQVYASGNKLQFNKRVIQACDIKINENTFILIILGFSYFNFKGTVQR